MAKALPLTRCSRNDLTWLMSKDKDSFSLRNSSPRSCVDFRFHRFRLSLVPNSLLSKTWLMYHTTTWYARYLSIDNDSFSLTNFSSDSHAVLIFFLFSLLLHHPVPTLFSPLTSQHWLKELKNSFYYFVFPTAYLNRYIRWTAINSKFYKLYSNSRIVV